MYLTRIDLDSHNRGLLRAVGDCQQLHQIIMRLFESDRKSADVLYRVRKDSRMLAVYIYSNRAIDRERLLPGMNLAGQRDLTAWLDTMREGQNWSFDLLASPTKKVMQDGRKNSQRRILRTMNERFAWLERKGTQNGFRLLYCKELEGGQMTGRHAQERGGQMYLDQYHYQGVLQIIDAERFQLAVQRGIGPGKSYGLGMLMLSQLS